MNSGIPPNGVLCCTLDYRLAAWGRSGYHGSASSDTLADGIVATMQ